MSKDRESYDTRFWMATDLVELGQALKEIEHSLWWLSCHAVGAIQQESSWRMIRTQGKRIVQRADRMMMAVEHIAERNRAKEASEKAIAKLRGKVEES